MPLMGGTIRVFFGTCAGLDPSVVPNGAMGGSTSLGFGTVAITPGVLPNKREPLGTAVGVTPWYFPFVFTYFKVVDHN